MKRLLLIFFLCSSVWAQGSAIPPYATTFIRTLLDDSTQATAQTTLGLGTGDSPTFAGLTLTAILQATSNSIIFQPAADSTTFFRVHDDGGTPILNMETENNRTLLTSLYCLDAIYVNSVYCIGDSLTANGGYEAQLRTLLGVPSWPVINKGVGGDSTAEMWARFNTDILAHGDLDYVIIWGGVVDVLVGYSAATIEANLQLMYTAASNAGATVISINISPCKGNVSWTADKQTVLDTVNTWIASTATDIDYKIDIYSVLEDPVTPDTLLPAYDFGDFLHLNSTGQALVGTTVYNDVTWPESTSLNVFTADATTRQCTVDYTSATYPFIVKSTDGTDGINMWHDNTYARINAITGPIRLQSTAVSNVTCFQDTDVDDAADGKAFQIYRKAAEGDTYISLYNDAAGVARLAAVSNGFIMSCTGGAFQIQSTADQDIKYFSGATSGETPEVYIYGYPVADAKRSLEIGTGVDAADTVSFDGLSNYWLRGNLKIGEGTAATDYTITADGETSDGVITWMEDEDYWLSDDDIVVTGTVSSTPDSTTLGVGVTTFAVTRNVMTITGDGAGNTISTITGAKDGTVLYLIFVDALVTITDTDAHTANTVDLAGTATNLTSADDLTLTIVFDGTSWYQTSRSVN